MQDEDTGKKDEDQGAVSGGLSKEQEPGVGVKEAPGEQREVEKKREVGKFVKEVPTVPEIPREVEKAGVKHAGPTAPVGKKAAKKVHLPLTDDEIVKGLHAHVWQSIRWLAVWCVRQLKKMHVVVKEVHGRLVRSGD